MKSQYTFPHEVVEDPSLGVEQKKALLSEWASDACAVEDFPTLRRLPGTPFPVTLSAVMDARLHLDRSLSHSETEIAGRDMAVGAVIAFDSRRRTEHRC